jgi:hypothetical protein
MIRRKCPFWPRSGPSCTIEAPEREIDETCWVEVDRGAEEMEAIISEVETGRFREPNGWALSVAFEQGRMGGAPGDPRTQARRYVIGLGRH